MKVSQSLGLKQIETFDFRSVIIFQDPGPESIRYEFSNGKKIGFNGHFMFFLGLCTFIIHMI
jgi:hypothetical protein